MSKKKVCVNLNTPGKYFNRRELEKLANYIVVEYFPGLDTDKGFVVDVNVVSDEEIQRINRRYLQRDRSTDVIAFSLLEGEKMPSPEEDLLGEIIISSDTAGRNASRYSHSTEKEMRLLFIHGMLHLSGRDEGKEIKEIQKKIIDKFYPGK